MIKNKAQPEIITILLIMCAIGLMLFSFQARSSAVPDFEYSAPHPEAWESTLFGQTNTDKPKMRETHVSEILAEGTYWPHLKGECEVATPDGSRVDILTDEYAIEVDWIHKWKEAVGQVLYYSIHFNKRPKVVLLGSRDPKDEKHYLRFMIVAAKYNIRVCVIDKQEVEDIYYNAN